MRTIISTHMKEELELVQEKKKLAAAKKVKNVRKLYVSDHQKKDR